MSEPEKVEPESFQPSSFEDALKGEKNETTTEVVETPKETEAPKAEVTQAPKTEALEDPIKQAEGFKAGMLAERRKRQELEAQIAASKVETPQNTQPTPTFFDDPEAFTKTILETKTREIENKLLPVLETVARQVHPDFDEKLEACKELMAQDPTVARQVFSSPNPAEAAYNVGKLLIFQKKYGADENSIRASMKKELMEEVRAQVHAEVLGKVQNKQNQPTSLSSARAAGGNAQPDWRPSSFADVLKK